MLPESGSSPKFEFKHAFPGEIFSSEQFDCAVAVALTAREIRFMTEQIEWYKKLPVFMLVGEPVSDKTVHVVPPAKANAGELRKIIVESCRELNDKLKNSFNAYDKKQNGKIKLSSIGEVLKDAG